jgi:hypothetical protein
MTPIFIHLRLSVFLCGSITFLFFPAPIACLSGRRFSAD